MKSLSDFFQKRNEQEKTNKKKEVKILSNIFSQKPNPIENKIQQQDNIKNRNAEYVQQQKPQQQLQNLQSTVFVGNIPLDLKHKDLKNFFKKYGQIQKIWFRSIPVQRNKMGPKASHILKKYVEGSNSMNAYVKFTDIQNAKKACQQNGRQLRQNTIRVTMATQKQQDFTSTIFVGNLPFNITEDQLRTHFQNVGKILNVRVIKNNFTHMGIGIGYVRFERESEMKNAIAQLDGSVIKERNIRVRKAIEKKRLEKKVHRIQQKKLGKFKPKNVLQNKEDSQKNPQNINNEKISKKKFIKKQSKKN